MDKHLHIVCFTVPYPADYGGVIDVFYRIKALHELGVKIHLHCFDYGRGEQPELNKYTTEVNYYERYTGLKGFSFRLPYIVRSRANKGLLQNLLKDDHPVLLEGIHSTYFLFTDQLRNKKIFARLHNVEFEYYGQLAKNEPSFFKRLYFNIESRLLKNYEERISNKAMLLTISKKDSETFQKKLGANNIQYLPPFLPQQEITAKEGKADYCLYHGNLSVAENERAAMWLSENIFKELSIPLVIAGKDPSKKLQLAFKQFKNVALINNPSEEKMNELISNAQINIIPSFNTTGIKIKLLNALFMGRHCIVNNAAISETGLGSFCYTAETGEEFKKVIKQLFDEPFTAQEIGIREQVLKKEFDNKTNAELLMQWIY